MDASGLNASWYTVEEIAQLLKISRSNVYQLTERGKLAAHRIGIGRGTIRVAKSDLDAYLQSVRYQVPVLPSNNRSRATRPSLFRHIDVSQLPSSRT
jgi:excisionase family DNA binding protein